MHPDKFRIIFNKDAGVSGNLEINVFKTAHPAIKSLAHSKREKKQGYPAENWEAFHVRLDQSMKEL